MAGPNTLDDGMTAEHEARKLALIKRLRRVEGQIRGIQGMMERDADCESTVQQLTAARRALDKVFYETLACALQQELDTGTPADAGAQAQLEKISNLLTKYG